MVIEIYFELKKDLILVIDKFFYNISTCIFAYFISKII